MDASPPRIPTPALIDLIGNRVSLDDPILLVASMAEQLQARSVAELNAVVADAVDKISAASFQANTDAQRRSEAIITKATSFAAGHIREAGTAAAKTLTDKLEGQIDAVYQTSRRAMIAAWISGACAVSAALLLPSLADRHGLLIVDTAGFGNQAAMVAAAGADLVMVPVTPGEGDVIEAQRTVSYVAGLGRSTRRTIPVRVIANRIRRTTTLSRHVLSQLETLKLPRVQTVLSEAVSLGEIGFSGVLPRDGTAATEIAGLVMELRGAGWLPTLREVVTAKMQEGVEV